MCVSARSSGGGLLKAARLCGGDALGRVIFVTSFKGGVGKTTVTANLAVTLALSGKRVMIVDGDFGMRCMDMILGLQSDVLYNVCDVLTGVCTVEDAAVRHETGLDFLAAPMGSYDPEIPKTAFFSLFRSLRDKYDFVFIDSSAEKSLYYLAFAAAADDALVVAMHRSTAIRAAEKTAYTLSELGFRNLRLIVNCYDSALAESKALPDLYQIIKRSAVRLLGVIPKDDTLVERQEKGECALCSKEKYLTCSEKAFINITKRMTGGVVPLLDGVSRVKIKRKNIEL